jgi:hypothetical protein
MLAGQTLERAIAMPWLDLVRIAVEPWSHVLIFQF